MRAPKIHRPPGYKLLRFAEFIFTKKTYTTVLEPVIRDLRDEYYEALDESRLAKARYVHFRGCWSFCAAVGAQWSSSAVTTLLKAIGKAAGPS